MWFIFLHFHLHFLNQQTYFLSVLLNIIGCFSCSRSSFYLPYNIVITKLVKCITIMHFFIMFLNKTRVTSHVHVYKWTFFLSRFVQVLVPGILVHALQKAGCQCFKVLKENGNKMWFLHWLYFTLFFKRIDWFNENIKLLFLHKKLLTLSN